MNPKGLASNRRMKKGGRAAVIPLGEVNDDRPEDSQIKIPEYFDVRCETIGVGNYSGRGEFVSCAYIHDLFFAGHVME